MITVNIIEDEDLQGVLKKFLSSLLPHQNYDADYFSTNLQSVFRYIHLEEMNMEYYVLFKLCNDLNKIKSLHTAYVPSLMRSVLENTLNTSLGDAITSPNFFNLKVIFGGKHVKLIEDECFANCTQFEGFLRNSYFSLPASIILMPVTIVIF